jgi:vacuolar-type H+-ATPase subunit I/STV1
MSSSDAPVADAGPGGALNVQQTMQDAQRSVQQVVGREVTREEVASLIGRIQQLEQANQAKQDRIEKLQESKANEMAKIVDETIMKWVNDLKFKDEETKQRFITGAQVRIVHSYMCTS